MFEKNNTIPHRSKLSARTLLDATIVWIGSWAWLACWLSLKKKKTTPRRKRWSEECPSPGTQCLRRSKKGRERINLIFISFPLINFNLLLNFLSFPCALVWLPTMVRATPAVPSGKGQGAGEMRRGVGWNTKRPAHRETDIFHIAFESAAEAPSVCSLRPVRRCFLYIFVSCLILHPSSSGRTDSGALMSALHCFWEA